MKTTFPIAVNYTIQCTECGKKAELTIRLIEESEVPQPWLPYDWSVVRDNKGTGGHVHVLCPDHELEIRSSVS